MAMIDKKQNRTVVLNIISVLTFIVLINLVSIEIIEKRRILFTILGLSFIGMVIKNYLMSRTTLISWNEPKAIWRERSKKKIISELQNTSWVRVCIYIFVLFPLCIYAFIHKYPHRSIVPINIIMILSAIFLVVTIGAVLSVSTMLYFGTSRIEVCRDGIRVFEPGDNVQKYYYNKMSELKLLSSLQGDACLSWVYEGKEFLRGISREVDLHEIESAITLNSHHKLTRGDDNG